MPADNLQFWNQLCETDPGATKKFKRNGFEGTDINVAWIMKKLTSQFGPCGVGWRFLIDDEDYQYGHPLEFDADGRPTFYTQIHVVRGHLEYRPAPGEEWVATGPQFGQTTFTGMRNSGQLFTDEEAPKKSVTDAFKKCVVMLGLTADIHMGMWDGSKYLNDIDSTPPPPAPTRRQRTAPPAPGAKPAGPPTSRRESAPAKTKPKPQAPPAEPEAPWEGDATNYRTPNEWNDYLEETMPDEAQLLEIVTEACASGHIDADPAEWEQVCAVFADVFRIVCVDKTPARDAILDLLKGERKKLDGRK